MHSAPHRNNSDFQLRHFIAGSCYTADGAWALLYNQKLDIEMKLSHTRANLVRRKAKKMELDKRSAETTDDIEKIKLEADWMEYNSNEGLLELAIAGAEKELRTIMSLMAELEPQREFAHLPLLEATEAAQRKEWLGEFRGRIENYLMTQGSLPQDQLEAMRKHPDFEEQIVPHIKKTMIALETAPNRVDLLTNTPNLLLPPRGNENAA
jgi:hypothetical protein